MATCDICGPALKAPEIVSAEGADLDTLWDTQVKESAQQGCPGCRVLYESVIFFVSSWADREKSDYGSAMVLKEFVGDLLRLELLLSVVPTVDEETSSLSSRSERTSKNIMGLEIYTTTDIPSPWKGITDARHLPKNPCSEQRWSLVREWITQCNNDHLNCQTSSSQFYSPKRLLDVTRISAEIPAAIDHVRLVENADTCQNYICLSYCWGDYIAFVAVTSNLDSLKNGIPLLSLAKTFQDAIYVTRALGIKYLWIDALCILQDDDRDWDQQSSEMANIYGHAYLTIAASSAQNPTVGFLNLASGDPHKLYETHGTTPMGEDYSIFARVARHQHGVDVTTDEYGSQPLLSRAWAYQEHMLSPRVLQFGSQEMYWECSDAKFCECRTRYEILDRRTLGHRRNPKGDLQDALSNCVNNPDLMVAVWHGIVQKYSGRWLTFAKDKLPALSGVARLIENRTKSRYYAGAWGHSIIPDLHWRVTHYFRPNPEQYLAPSWSWASVGNKVEFFEFEAAQAYQLNAESHISFENAWRIRILEISTTLRGLDSTGMVSTGHLVVEGFVIQAELRYDETSRNLISKDTGYIHTQDHWPFSCALDCHPSDLSVHALPSGSPILCLVLEVWHNGLTVFRRDSWHMPEKNLSLLVLRRSTRNPQGYERVGMSAEGYQKHLDVDLLLQKAERKVLRII